MAAITVACIKYIPTKLPSQDKIRIRPVNSNFARNNFHRHSLYIWNNNSNKGRFGPFTFMYENTSDLTRKMNGINEPDENGKISNLLDPDVKKQTFGQKSQN
ncbi:hypothetical protein HanIR_Chr05g0220591 [Helianthus annuus]|nr:hypothetical protein HanIR_Chr05g0220591 [Helianthus annuus]